MFCVSPFLFHLLKVYIKAPARPFTTKSKHKLRKKKETWFRSAVTSFALSTLIHLRKLLKRNTSRASRLQSQHSDSCDVIDFTIVGKTRSQAHLESDEWSMPSLIGRRTRYHEVFPLSLMIQQRFDDVRDPGCVFWNERLIELERNWD